MANYSPWKKWRVQKQQDKPSDIDLKTRGRSELHPKGLRFGTTNTRKLAILGAANILADELRRYKKKFVALQETRWSLSSKINTTEYIIHYSGNNDGRYQRGIDFAVSRRMQHAVIYFEAKDRKICVVRIKGKFREISVVHFYAPTEDTKKKTNSMKL